MKSWAHTYMAGSLLGTILIVAALVAFVPLVSLNAPDDWPTPGLGFASSADKGGVEVSSAVVVAARHPETGGLSSNPLGGSTAAAGAAIVAVPASGPETHTQRPGRANGDGPAKGTAAVSPASVEVSRNPGSHTSEGAGAGVPLPNPPETGRAPVPTATDAEADSVGNLGETPPMTPIDAGVDAGGPAESQPPEERPESVPPPPSGSSSGGGDGSDCPAEGDEDEAEQIGDVPSGDAAAPLSIGLSAVS